MGGTADTMRSEVSKMVSLEDHRLWGIPPQPLVALSHQVRATNADVDDICDGLA